MWSEFDLAIWHLRGPSRRLRKLYQSLARVHALMAGVRASNPCPEHAPTACRIIRSRLRRLQPFEADLLRRIARLQNDDD